MNITRIYGVAVLLAVSGAASAASDSEAVAMMAGALIAQADICNLPTKPIEAAMNKWFDNNSVASSERQRLSSATDLSRRAMKGYTPKGGCSEVKRSIEDYRAKVGPGS